MTRHVSRNSAVMLSYVLGAITSASLPILYFKWMNPEQVQTRPLERRLSTNEWIRPLLDCRHPQSELEDLELKDLLGKELRQIEASGDMKVSLLMRNYVTGNWVSFRDDVSIQPGSLIKVALLIAYLKKSESVPGVLERKIHFSDPKLLKFYDIQGIQPSQRLSLGKAYTIWQLLEAAIIRSDNVAAFLLEQDDNREELKRVAIELDVPLHQGSPPLRPLTIQEYAVLFKVLYNASYLNDKNSSLALELLSRSEFRSGIVAGVPSEVRVAHKFGESTRPDGSRSFGECGLFFSPQQPYLLCLSIRGTAPQSKMIEAAAQISKLVYGTVYIPLKAAASTTQANAMQ